jgi:hypothetical protein
MYQYSRAQTWMPDASCACATHVHIRIGHMCHDVEDIREQAVPALYLSSGCLRTVQWMLAYSAVDACVQCSGCLRTVQWMLVYSAARETGFMQAHSFLFVHAC